MSKIYECLIIGAGPSGIGAAIKLHQAGVEVAIIEMSTPGGKINIAPRVDNYPGQHEIEGPDLAVIFFERLMKDSRFDNMPLILETPDESKWAEEIAWLRSVE